MPLEPEPRCWVEATREVVTVILGHKCSAFSFPPSFSSVNQVVHSASRLEAAMQPCGTSISVSIDMLIATNHV